MFRPLIHPQTIGRISRVIFYPIKSARGIEVQSAKLTPEGLAGDREFVVVRREPTEGVHHFVTQRKGEDRSEFLSRGAPLLSLVVPQLTHETLKLTWNGREAIDIALNLPCTTVPIGVWGDKLMAHDQGDPVAEWLSDHIGIAVRLVRMGDIRRKARQNWMQNNNPLRFQDAYPIHWFSQGSLDELSTRAGEEIAWSRFRPNFIVADATASAEHTIYHGEVNGIPFVQPKPCDRCPTTMVDQQTGILHRTGQPLKALAKYKSWINKEGQQKVIFGENILPLASGTISVGDELVATSVRDPPLTYGGR